MANTKVLTKADALRMIEENKDNTGWFSGNNKDMFGDYISRYDRMHDLLRNRMQFGEAEAAVIIGALALAGAEIIEKDYDHIALCYAEEYGVIEYHVVGNEMIYYTSFPMEHATYRAVVSLDTLEEERTQMRGYYKPYKALIGGKYQANYEA